MNSKKLKTLVFVLGLMYQIEATWGLQLTFDENGCTMFRELLSEHTRTAKYYGEVSERIGIAGLGLFFIPVIPYPLGLSAILLSEKGESNARRGLKELGVSGNNWELINCKCAELLTTIAEREVKPLTGMIFDGKNRTSIILGAMALAYGSLIHVALLIWCCFECTTSTDVEFEYKRENTDRRRRRCN